MWKNSWDSSVQTNVCVWRKELWHSEPVQRVDVLVVFMDRTAVQKVGTEKDYTVPYPYTSKEAQM